MPRAGGSSRPGCGRGGCDRWHGAGQWLSARRKGWSACPLAATAPQRLQTPPARLPRRGRSRRGSRSAQRGRGPTRRGRRAREWLVLHDRTDFDRTPEPGRGDLRGELDRGVEIVRLEEKEAAKRLLGVDERSIRGERAAVVHAHGGGRFGVAHLD